MTTFSAANQLFTYRKLLNVNTQNNGSDIVKSASVTFVIENFDTSFYTLWFHIYTKKKL
jgi:hypothetical protein